MGHGLAQNVISGVWCNSCQLQGVNLPTALLVAGLGVHKIGNGGRKTNGIQAQGETAQRAGHRQHPGLPDEGHHAPDDDA